MSATEKRFWLKAIEGLNESTESIENLAYQISRSQDYALPMNIWFSLLVEETSEDGIIKFILLGGCIAELSKQTKPDLFLTTRKLLTWSIFAISQRSLSLLIKARLLRLIKTWRSTNLFGLAWAQYMLAAFEGVSPAYLGLADFYINLNGVASVRNSQVLQEVVKPFNSGGMLEVSEAAIQKTLAKLKREKEIFKVKVPMPAAKRGTKNELDLEVDTKIDELKFVRVQTEAKDMKLCGFQDENKF